MSTMSLMADMTDLNPYRTIFPTGIICKMDTMIFALPKLPVTHAYIVSSFNPDGGAIIAVDNQKMNQANPNVPTVNQLSDVLYLVWSQLTNGANRRNLSKVIRSSVGEATEEIIKEAIGTSDKSQARWPGREFGPDTQAFKVRPLALHPSKLFHVLQADETAPGIARLPKRLRRGLSPLHPQAAAGYEEGFKGHGFLPEKPGWR